MTPGSEERRKKLQREKFCSNVSNVLGVLFAISLFVFFFYLHIHYSFDRPQACTCDGGKTISYFLLPSEDNKSYTKVFPEQKEYEIILNKGDYERIDISPRASI